MMHNSPARDAAYVKSRANSAAQDMQHFQRGGRRVGLNCGQYSLIDIIRACLELTGPASVTLATWSSGIRDGESAAFMLETGLATSMTWVVDASFCERQPEYVASLQRRFGDDCVIATMIHAKFALIRGDGWNLAVRTSMNLNRNDRFELWEVDDDAALCDFLTAWVADLAANHRKGWHKRKPEVRKEWASTDMGQPATEIPKDEWGWIE
jgi:hypothetical protein